jgi:hypothetical protein
MNKTQKTPPLSPRTGSIQLIIIGIIVALLVIAIGIWYFSGSKSASQNPPNGVACTQEAMECPDGSYVGRTGPACEFSACPSTAPSANWKTYNNSVIGFSFKYPSEFTTKPTQQSLPFGQTAVTIAGSKSMSNTNPIPLPQILLTVSPKKTTDTIENDAKQIAANPSACNGTLIVATTTLMGQEAALITCNLRQSLNLYPYATLDFYHKTLSFKLVLNNYPAARDVIKQIGGSFIFTK